MSDRLLERCTVEFENCIARLQSDVASRCRASIPWAPYEQQFTKADIPMLTREIRKAYDARAAFAVEGPAWAQMLPLGQECSTLLRATGAMHLLGLYSFSLQLAGHDYVGHPRFYNFACGVMAHEATPAHVRDDVDLQIEFPARELQGLCGRLVWAGESLPVNERLQALGKRMNA